MLRDKDYFKQFWNWFDLMGNIFFIIHCADKLKNGISSNDSSINILVILGVGMISLRTFS